MYAGAGVTGVLTGITLYSFGSKVTPRARAWLNIVFDCSHTFQPFPPAAAQYIRFFAYTCPVYPRSRTLYSIFRIHLPRLPPQPHIIFDFSHTFAPFTLAAAQYIRFFAYICPVYPRSRTLYSIFRIHLPRLPPQPHIIFDFSHTFPPFTLATEHCIRFFAYICPGSPAAPASACPNVLAQERAGFVHSALWSLLH